MLLNQNGKKEVITYIVKTAMSFILSSSILKNKKLIMNKFSFVQVLTYCCEKSNMLMIGKTEESKECSNNFDIDYVDVDDFLTNN